MGNQQSQGEIDAESQNEVQHYLFYCTATKKYLAVGPNGEVHFNGLGGAFCSFRAELLPGDNGPVQEPLARVRLRVLGNGEDMAKPYLVMTSNLNIRGGAMDEPGSVWAVQDLEIHTVASNVYSDTCKKGRAVALYSLAFNCYVQNHTNGVIRALPTSKVTSSSSLPLSTCALALDIRTLSIQRAQSMQKWAKRIVKILPKGKEAMDYPLPDVTAEDARHYAREGYVVIDNVIPPEVIEAAKHKIQEGQDKGMDAEKNILGAPRWNKEWRRAKEVLDLLLRSPALRDCEELTGWAVIPPQEAQIALRRPKLDGTKDFALELDWHIDAYEKNTAARFGILVVVSLSDWHSDNMGNFTVYPGTHTKVADMMDTMTWNEWNKAVKNSVDLGVAPQQLHAKTGSVIFAHPLLAHDVAPNISEDVRWAVIFRPQLVDRKLREQLLHPQDE